MNGAVARLGWPLVVVLAGLPVARWAMLMPLDQRFGAPVVALLSIGQITGMIGLTLYAFDLVLSTRLAVFEDLFGGLNRVYIAHHIIGAISLVALMVHPVMLALRLAASSIRDAALLLLPQVGDLPMAYGIFSLLGLIALMIVTFFVSLPYRVWLMTHKLLGAVFFLGGLHVLLVPSALYNDALLKWLLIGYVVLGLAAFAYRTLLPRIFVRRYEYSVRAATLVGEGVIQIDMLPVRHGINFKAGQFVFLSFRQSGISQEWHPFSVSSAPNDANLSVTVKALGSYTRLLTQLQAGLAGSTVWVEGAYGRFSFRNFKNPHQVWIAGGIGVTPFLSMARDLGNAPCFIDLYYSVRTEAELVDYATLAQIGTPGVGQNFRLIPFVSSKQGYLTAKYVSDTSGGLTDKDILLCGPPAMMKSLKDQMAELGVKKAQIHSEEFSMS